MLLVLLSYGVAVGVLWWKVRWQWALAAAIVLPISGWATLRVLDRLRLGKSNMVIARDLDMQESTVKVHVRQIMRKLGASNRTQAALFAAASTSTTAVPPPPAVAVEIMAPLQPT